jgi:hypothetical protein
MTRRTLEMSIREGRVKIFGSKFICPTCNNLYELDEHFKDELSETEFLISGMCQACQDSVFKGDENE